MVNERAVGAEDDEADADVEKVDEEDGSDMMDNETGDSGVNDDEFGFRTASSSLGLFGLT